MKKALTFAVCFLLLCGMVLLPSCTASGDDYYVDLPPNWTPAARLPDDAIILNDEIGIPDVALYIAVLSAIEGGRASHFGRTGEGTFTAGEAAAVTSIRINVHGSTHPDLDSSDLRWQPPRNLRGVEHLRNLEELRLSLEQERGLRGGLDNYNELKRLEHLPYLRTLIFVDLLSLYYSPDNPPEFLRDLRPLQNLTQLTRLNMYVDGLTSLDGIQNLTNLEYLSVRTTNVNVTGVLVNLRGIEHLTNLRDLNVSRGQLTNLDEVRYLVNLTSLWVSNNQLADISAVAHLKNLENLDVSQNQLTNLSDVRNLVNLTNLAANHNQLTNLDDVRNLVNLTRLMARENPLTDASAVSYLPNLHFFDARSGFLSDTNPDFYFDLRRETS
ncbi:MAG: leucine-rich repeat domain-containing protein [Oscillospiraceae bacterium]|nr:leucine-rich repeat domain-containing protein [Oscillospiraceae bacterium]